VSTSETERVHLLLENIKRLRDVCALLQRDRDELAAALAFVRLGVDTINMTEDAIAMRGRLALVDGLRALLAETAAELVTVRAMTSPR
jgi:hypothetical protein